MNKPYRTYFTNNTNVSAKILGLRMCFPDNEQLLLKL